MIKPQQQEVLSVLARRRMSCCVAGAAIAAFASGTVCAQSSIIAPSESDRASGQLQDIVVTATRTGASSTQHTPIAISVIGGDLIKESLIVNVKDLVQITPNMSVAQTTASAQIYIRGIGSNNVFAGSDPDVTVQSDGVYIARAYGQFTDFNDVARIEVLRGPQGTLYGRNAVGGTINIISKIPTDEFHAQVSLTGGTYGLLQQQSYISGALVPGTVEASLSTNYIRHNDYFENVVPGVHGAGNADRGGARAQLRFHPGDKLNMITRADYSRGDEHVLTYTQLQAPVAYAPVASGLIGSYRKFATNTPSRNKTNLWGISEEINYALSDNLALKSITAYRRSQYDLLVDSDGTEVAAGTSAQAEISKQFTQELDLNFKSSKFEAVAGLFYFHDREQTDFTSFNPPSPRTPAPRSLQLTFAPVSIARSVAAFSQGTLHLGKLGITAGVRYTEDRRSIDQQVVAASLNPATFGVSPPGFPISLRTGKRYRSTTPKIGIDLQATPAILLYASATRGFKSGGTNFAATNPLAVNFRPETIWSYEGGAKTEFLDHRLRLNISLFKYDYKDLQVSSLIGGGLAAISNAATAKVKGVEIEATAKPTSGLLFTASFSALNARYDIFKQATVPTTLIPFVSSSPRFDTATSTFDASGNRLNAAPRTSFILGGEYGWSLASGKMTLHANYYHQSRAFYDPSNVSILSQAPYGTLNARLGWRTDDSKWSAELVGKNITQKGYFIAMASNGVQPAGLPGEPRTVALQLTRNW